MLYVEDRLAAVTAARNYLISQLNELSRLREQIDKIELSPDRPQRRSRKSLCA